VFLLPALASAELSVGDVGRAVELVNRVKNSPQSRNNVRASLDGLRVEAIMAGTCQYWDQADHCFTQAIELARRVGYPYFEGRLLLDWGVVLKETGRADRAASPLQTSAMMFASLGAKREAERAGAALASLL
jgi:hypothetical protein